MGNGVTCSELDVCVRVCACELSVHIMCVCAYMRRLAAAARGAKRQAAAAALRGALRKSSFGGDAMRHTPAAAANLAAAKRMRVCVWLRL